MVEDGPTLTHGGMDYGAGVIAAKKYGASEIVDPRPYAMGTIRKTYEKYPFTGAVLPAMGYGVEQIHDLENTINTIECQLVLFATPIQLTHILSINKETLRVRYDYQDYEHPFLEEILIDRFENRI